MSRSELLAKQAFAFSRQNDARGVSVIKTPYEMENTFTNTSQDIENCACCFSTLCCTWRDNAVRSS